MKEDSNDIMLTHFPSNCFTRLYSASSQTLS